MSKSRNIQKKCQKEENVWKKYQKNKCLERLTKRGNFGKNFKK